MKRAIWSAQGFLTGVLLGVLLGASSVDMVIKPDLVVLGFDIGRALAESIR